MHFAKDEFSEKNLYGGGSYWSREHQKNTRTFKICILCIIMHKICILLKITFLSISDDSDHFFIFGTDQTRIAVWNPKADNRLVYFSLNWLDRERLVGSS